MLQQAEVDWKSGRLDLDSSRFPSNVCGWLTVKRRKLFDSWSSLYFFALDEKCQHSWIGSPHNGITSPIYRLSKGHKGHSSSSILLKNNCLVDWNPVYLTARSTWQIQSTSLVSLSLLNRFIHLVLNPFQSIA